MVMPNRAVDPTPEEIRERCEEIQREWTDEDFIRRKGIRFPSVYEAWKVPIMKTPDFAK